MKWRSRWRKVISRVTPPKVYSTASPWSSVRTTRRYSRNSLSGIGCCPITRIAVCPVPMPRKTRPGAIWLIVAIECAVTGASAGNRDAGANLDAPGGLRRERHRGVAVGPDHLGVGYPGAVVTQLLDVTNQVPFIDMSVEADSEFHRYVLLIRGWRCWEQNSFHRRVASGQRHSGFFGFTR